MKMLVNCTPKLPVDLVMALAEYQNKHPNTRETMKFEMGDSHIEVALQSNGTWIVSGHTLMDEEFYLSLKDK